MNTPGGALDARLTQALGDRFQLEGVIGRGGMGVVYRARDRKLGRTVAIKVLSDDVCRKVGAERFVREVQITATLQHPHIVPIIDTGESDGVLWSVMPFIEGESLRRHIDEHKGPMPAGEALLIAREVAEALAYAHGQGIVHRDIKPDNILLSNGQAMIADFGIARARHLAQDAGLTQAGLPIGTPAYMSPEQAKGREEVDGRSDVYALGCVLYEMLAGRIPFEGKTSAEVLSQHISRDPPTLERVRPDLDPRVVALVRRAMAKKRSERFPSAGALAGELRALLGEPARHATPGHAGGHGSAPRQTPLVLRRLRLISSPGGALVLGALVVGVLALATLVRDRAGAAGAAAPVGAAVAAGERATVAVLPFRALSSGADDVYMAEGIAEEIWSQLSDVPELTVISRTSAQAVARSQLTARQIADSLGVTHVLEGTLQRGGMATSVQVRLVDARADRSVWREDYVVGQGEVFAMQAKIAQRVAEALAATVAVTPASRRAATARPLAFAALNRGRYFLGRGGPDDLPRAVEAFREAIAQDSNYAEAHASLAQALWSEIAYGYRSGRDLYSSAAEADVHAERALALDSTNLRAISVAADLEFTIEGDTRRSLLVIGPEAREHPNVVELQMHHAHLLAMQGDVDSALAVARRAIALDPLGAQWRHSLMILAIEHGRPEVAIALGDSLLARAPDDAAALAIRGYAQVAAGRAEACAATRLGALRGLRAICLWETGRTAEAEAAADSLRRELEEERYVFTHQFGEYASWLAWRGDAAGALRWLDKMAAHTPLLDDWMIKSRVFARVRDDAAFRDGLGRLRLQIRDRLLARRAMMGA